MFAYCNNNPVNAVDSNGKHPVCLEIEGPLLISGQELDPYNDIPYGISTIGFSGCEVIAIYNALLLVGHYVPFITIKKDIERRLRKGGGYGMYGLWGADKSDIVSTLLGYGVTPRKLEYKDLHDSEVMKEGSVLILGFWGKMTLACGITVPSIHTVAVHIDSRYDANNKYHVFNRYSDVSTIYHLDTIDFFGGEEKFEYAYIIEQ